MVNLFQFYIFFKTANLLKINVGVIQIQDIH